ncbi:hypothetical protein C5167_015303 [Papaver somniferum]|uniref:RNase H type-1 domain-containing protein n=1 Tax=Papaver somniferum TaxID=3469 RepID=A0A4Y7J9R1_PAPSO|nr:hypothetical protein C5167_015303 [Papaver somniferum]
MPSFGDVIVLEPVSLASLPPEHVITDEEFEKEIDLMMMDSGSMDVEPSSAHDLVRKIRCSRSDFGLVLDAVSAEATALFLAISWVKELNLSKVLFVCDCLQVVGFVNGVSSSVGRMCSDLLEDCRNFTASRNAYKVVYIIRYLTGLHVGIGSSVLKTLRFLFLLS